MKRKITESKLRYIIKESINNVIEEWWDSLDYSEKYNIVMDDPEIDEFRLSYKYENGIPSGDAYDDAIDKVDFVNSYWDSCDISTKLDIYKEYTY